MRLKPLFVVLLSTVFSLPVYAIDFANYVPTLGDNASYSLEFTEVAQGSEDFTYYIRNADDSLTPVYYQIGAPVKNNSATFLSRIDTDQGGADITGNFRDLVSPWWGGAIDNQYGSTIGDITGDFIGNSAMAEGGAIANFSTIGNITGDFIGNSVDAYYSDYFPPGGAIHNIGTIGNIIGNFIGNHMNNGEGGAIGNYGGGIDKITGDFIGNSAMGYGGAIYNSGTIGDITGDFIGNSAAAGGAIIGGTIGDITGDFIGNSTTYDNYGESNEGGGAIAYVQSGNITGDFIGNSAMGYGGAIIIVANRMGDISGDFIGNYASYNGGAIYSIKGGIGNITGDFIGNSASGDGGAIYNYDGTIGDIIGDFIENNTKGDGGAIYNDRYDSTIGDITGNFIGNNAGSGGAIYHYDGGTIGNITGDFIGNSAMSYGGAINNSSYYLYTISTISGSFISNHIGYGEGGAIYTSANMSFLADGKDNFFTGNYTGTKGSGEIYNAIYADSVMTPLVLTFTTKAKGNFIFDDNIRGGRGYTLAIIGDDTGKFFMNNDIIGATDINVSDTMLIFGEGPYGNGRILASASPVGEGIIKPADATPSITNLSLTNAQLYLHNNYYETVNVLNYTSAGDTLLHINVGKVDGEWTSDILHVDGNLLGETKVVVYSASKDTDLESVLFVDAPNDAEKVRNAFSVYRVYGSPYKWTAKGEHTNGSQWYLTMGNEDNEYKDLTPAPIEPAAPPALPELPEKPVDPEPNPDPNPEIELNPEVMAFRGLQVAAIEQTRSMVNNIRSKVAANKVLPDTCLFIVDDNELNHNAWVNPIYHTANIDAPVEIEADIWGLEAGFDLQANRNNKFGIFASYRQGEYDLSGKGEEYFSEVGSKIDIDSHMFGIYYRYDYRHLWAFATAHGGVQKADITTNDGVSSDTDGTEVGASAEMGYLFNLSNTLKLEPSLGVFYTEIDFDDAESTYGTNASWEKIRQTEVEAGIKLEKYFNGDHGFTKVYVKPSVVQVITNGDEVRITGLDKISTYEDGTLGRIELGARHAITDALSAYGFVNYTFGSDYDATSLGAGASYSW